MRYSPDKGFPSDVEFLSILRQPTDDEDEDSQNDCEVIEIIIERISLDEGHFLPPPNPN